MSKTEDKPLSNPRHERFAQLAAFTSAAEAYRQAFDISPEDFRKMTRRDVYQLAGRPEVIVRIGYIQMLATKPLQITREWLVGWWFKRMTYNPHEITAWVVHACEYCHGDNHLFQWREPDYMEALANAERDKSPLPDIAGGFGYSTKKAPHPDCPKCDGRGLQRSDFSDTSELSAAAAAAFEGVKQTAQGMEIKMADKAKAAEQFAKLSGFDVQQVRLLTGDIPDDARLAELASDPLAIAAAYRTMMGGGTAH